MRISKTIVASVAALSLGLAAVSPASAAFRMGGGGGGFHGGGGSTAAVAWRRRRLAWWRRRLAWRRRRLARRRLARRGWRLRRLGLWAWRAWAGSRTGALYGGYYGGYGGGYAMLRQLRPLLRLRIRLRIRILTVCRPHSRRTPSRRPRTRRPPRAREEAPLRRGLFYLGAGQNTPPLRGRGAPVVVGSEIGKPRRARKARYAKHCASMTSPS